MTINKEILNYGDYVECNIPMKIYRTYNKKVKNVYKWLGIDTISASVPVYAKKVKILKDIDVDKYIDYEKMEGAEIFLLNTDGEFIKIPSKMSAGREFYVDGIEKIVALPANIAKEMDRVIKDYRTKDVKPGEHWGEISKGFLINEQADGMCQVVFDIDGTKKCYRYDELVFPNNFAYWTTNITQKELEDKANYILEEHFQELESFDNKIETALQNLASMIKNGLTYFKQYGFDDSETLQNEKCKELSIIVGEIIDNYNNYIKNTGLEIVIQKDFDLGVNLCEELKSIVSKYIENNASWLKERAGKTIESFGNSIVKALVNKR